MSSYDILFQSIYDEMMTNIKSMFESGDHFSFTLVTITN